MNHMGKYSVFVYCIIHSFIYLLPALMSAFQNLKSRH